jgi:predicted Zn-dependent protease
VTASATGPPAGSGAWGFAAYERAAAALVVMRSDGGSRMEFTDLGEIRAVRREPGCAAVECSVAWPRSRSHIARELAAFGHDGHAVEEVVERATRCPEPPLRGTSELVDRALPAVREVLRGCGEPWRVLASAEFRCVTFVRPDGSTNTVERGYARISLLVGRGPGESKATVAVPGPIESMEPDAVVAGAHDAVRRARQLRDLPPTPTGVTDLVLAPEAAAVLAHEIGGHLLEADNLGRLRAGDPSALPAGGRLADESVTMVDRADDVGKWGSIGLDDEGVPTERVTIIAAGRLAGVLMDRAHSDAAGRSGTGHGRRSGPFQRVAPRMGRIQLCPGRNRPGDLVAGVRDGLYIDRIGAAAMRPSTGEARLSIGTARVIRSGMAGQPVRGGMLRLDARSLLGAIEAVADDEEWYPSLCQKNNQMVPVGNGGATTLLRRLEVR